MTKAVVIQKIAERTGMNRSEANDAFELFLSTIKEQLKAGERVALVGFGTFFVKEKQARNGRNPRTGERIRIPPKMVPTFKPGKSFREMVDSGTRRPADETDIDDD